MKKYHIQVIRNPIDRNDSFFIKEETIECGFIETTETSLVFLDDSKNVLAIYPGKFTIVTTLAE